MIVKMENRISIDDNSSRVHLEALIKSAEKVISQDKTKEPIDSCYKENGFRIEFEDAFRIIKDMKNNDIIFGYLGARIGVGWECFIMAHPTNIFYVYRKVGLRCGVEISVPQWFATKYAQYDTKPERPILTGQHDETDQ